MNIKNLNIKQTAKPPEINAAKVLKHCILGETVLTVGDEAKLNLPDIYSEDLSIGFEVVQMERDEDLDTKYVWDEIAKNNYDFSITKIFCDEKYPNKYHLQEYNGKVFCFMTKGKSHRVDWMKPIYDKLINNKLEKLNNGNYSGITDKINLCISIVHRTKRLYDAELIIYSYTQLAKTFERKFKNLYIIESDKLFVVYPDNIEDIKPKIWQNCICDFEITGNNYIEEIKYAGYGTITDLQII